VTNFLRVVVASLLLCWLVVQVAFVFIVSTGIEVANPVPAVAAWSVIGVVLGLCALALR
jgi:hypothetical protein